MRDTLEKENCGGTAAQAWRCPTKWDIWAQIMALLPRGRAWQTHEDVVGALYLDPGSQAGAFEVSATQLSPDFEPRGLTVAQQYWAAYAEVLEHLHQRACALLAEFFCSSASEMLPEWWTEYGFPDACQPYDTLCDKVRAQGGSTCAYFAGIAWRRGWALECDDNCGAVAGCAEAGQEVAAGPTPRPWIRFRVRLADSPAAQAAVPFEAGAVEAGCTPPCPPFPDALFCLLESIRPAHVAAFYEVA